MILVDSPRIKLDSSINMERSADHLAQEPSNNQSIYPELDDDSPATFPWMSHYQPVPVEEFPRTPGPIVYEGYIPDALEGSGWQGPGMYGFGLPSNGDITQQSVEEAVREDPDFDVLEDGTGTDDDDMSVDDYPERGTSSESDANGTYTGTRSRTSDQPRKSWAATERGRGRGRGQATGRGRGRGRGRARGRGTGYRGRGGWNRGFRSGPRDPVEPSLEFTQLQQQALNAFIEELDNNKALNLILQAIAINPEVYAAHVLLSEIYFAKKEDEKAVAALFTGAHAAPREPDVWHQVADVCLQKTTLDRTRALEQAGYCFSRLLQMNQKDHDSLLSASCDCKGAG